MKPRRSIEIVLLPSLLPYYLLTLFVSTVHTHCCLESMLLLFVATHVIGRVYVLVFSARQHYMLSALYAIARPSVRPSRWCIIEQESHAVAGKPRDAAVNSDRYQQPVGQKQSE